MTPSQRTLRDALAAVPDEAAEAVGLTDPDLASGTGAWTAREVVRHLVAVEIEVWQPRLVALEAETFPSWPWVEPGLWSGPGDTSWTGALAAYRRARAATIARLDALGNAGWAKRGRHATYGVLDVEALLRIALDHDREHVAQIRGG